MTIIIRFYFCVTAVLCVSVNDFWDTSAFLPGDVTLVGIFTIRSSGNTEDSCGGDININSVMEVEAAKWTLRQLNKNNYIPNVKIGFYGLPNCLSEKLANMRAVQLVDLMKDRNSTHSVTTPANIIGIIGPSRSSDSEVVSRTLSVLPSEFTLPMVSFSSTSTSLNDREKYSNFFRTIPSDEVQIQTMTKLLVQLEWNYIAIIHENNVYGRLGASGLKKEVMKQGICVRSIRGFDTTYGVEVSTLSAIIKEIVLPSGGAVSGVVYFGGGISAKRFLAALKDASLGKDTPSVIFSEAVSLSKTVFDDDTLQVSRGNLILSPEYTMVDEFAKYWNNLFLNKSLLISESSSNPWLRDVFFEIQKCHVDDSNCQSLTKSQINSEFFKNAIIKYVLDAVFVFAKALKQKQGVICANNNCSSLSKNAVPTYLDAIRNIHVNVKSDFGNYISTYDSVISFDNNGDVKITDGQIEFEVYNHRQCFGENRFCFMKVAHYINDSLSVNTSVLKDYSIDGNERPYHKARCKVGDVCTVCLPNKEQVYYIDGDYIVVVAFAVHNKGIEPLSCHGIRSAVGLDVALAAEYAVETVNKEKLFGNRTVGMLLLDTCNNPLVIQDRILNLHGPGGIPGIPNDAHKRMLGYVGGLGSTPTIAMASLTKSLDGTPHVGFASTTVVLSDRKQFPNFVRVSMSLATTADNMIQVAKHIGAQYVQIIYSSGNYGGDGKNALINSAKKHHICIANIKEVPEHSNYNDILEHLRKKPSAKIVLAFLRSHVGPNAIGTIASNMRSDEFYFIGSEAMGTRNQYKTYPKLKGTLSVVQEMPQNPSFLSFLRRKIPTMTDTNSWLLNITQIQRKCYFPWSFDKNPTLPRECSESDTLGKDGIQSLDPWTPYVMNAAFALLRGSAQALKEICGLNGQICSDYRDISTVLPYIENVKLDMNHNGSLIPVFSADGHGTFGHRIYQIVSSGGVMDFKKVGHWSEVDGLQIDENIRLPEYSTQCPNTLCEKDCQSFYGTKQIESIPVASSSDTGMMVGVVITSCIAALFIVLCAVQSARLHRLQNVFYENTNRTDPYLSVVDDCIVNKTYETTAAD